MLPFAYPLGSKRVEKNLKKLLKENTNLNILRGRKACLKAIDTKTGGLFLISGDISPMDLVSHLPSYSEENDIPYIFIRKKILKYSSKKKNLTTCIFIESENINDLYKLLEIKI